MKNLTNFFVNLVEKLTEKFVRVLLFVQNQFDWEMSKSSQFLQDVVGVERRSANDFSVIIRFGSIHLVELIDERVAEEKKKTRRFAVRPLARSTYSARMHGTV